MNDLYHTIAFEYSQILYKRSSRIAVSYESLSKRYRIRINVILVLQIGIQVESDTAYLVIGQAMDKHFRNHMVFETS